MIAFRETTSSKLVAAVDDFTDLSKDKNAYLIKPPAAGMKRNPLPRKPRTTRGKSSVEETTPGELDLG